MKKANNIQESKEHQARTGQQQIRQATRQQTGVIGIVKILRHKTA